MGMILFGLVIVLCTALLVYLTYRLEDATGSKDSLICASVGSIVASAVVGVILLLTVTASYSNYVSIRTKYEATITQYKESVTMYKTHAVIDVKKAAFTDLKYQGYQANMANFIKDLRRQTTKYNEKLISKRIMKKNWFFNWIIVAPDDDMKIISLLD